MNFYVDSVLCPDVNGVGSTGGVFNCGLIGSSFTIECETGCDMSNQMVRELAIWDENAITIYGSASKFDCNEACYSGETDNLGPFFGAGSYTSWTNDRKDLDTLCVMRTPVFCNDMVGIDFTFTQTVEIE